MDSKNEEKKENEMEEKEKTISDFENEITGAFFEIETLGRMGARLFDNCGKTTVRGNFDGGNILGLISEKVESIRVQLEDMLQAIEAKKAA